MWHSVAQRKSWDKKAAQPASLKNLRDSNLLAVLTLLAAYGVSAYLFFGVTQIDVDIGRDFVAADLMLQGRVLYRDIEYWFGPFAPAVHYQLFRIFGPSVEVIFSAGIVAGLGIVLLSYALGQRVLGTWPACIGGLIVLTHAVFGGSILNYATPYTYSATYGLLFALLALYTSLRAVDDASPRWLALAGSAAAVAFTCKQEFALIAAGTVSLALVFLWVEDRRTALRALAAAVLGFGVVAPAAGTILLRTVTWDEFVANYYPRDSMVALAHFYRNMQGWGDTAPAFLLDAHIALLLNLGFILAGVSLLGLGINYLRGVRPPSRRGLMLLAAGAPLLWMRGYLWSYPATIALVVLVVTYKQQHLANRTQVLLLAAAAVLFGCRVLPNPDIRYYALLYFIPTLVVYLYLLFEIIVPHLERWAGARGWNTALAVVLTACFVVYHFFQTNYSLLERSAPLVTERGTVHIPADRLEETQIVLDEIRRRTQEGDPILLIPGNTMYYFLTKRQPASRYLDYIYATVIDGQPEAAEVRALTARPPSLILIFPLGSSIYIPGEEEALFGEAYNRRVYDWIKENYEEAEDVPERMRHIRFLVPQLRDAVGASASVPERR